MELQCNDNTKKRKWYNGYTFPLVPVIQKRKADDHNTSSFSFHWLIFKFWTLDAVDFELSLVLSFHWGFGVIGILPYLRWAIAIPFPYKLGLFIQRHFWRRPKSAGVV